MIFSRRHRLRAVLGLVAALFFVAFLTSSSPLSLQSPVTESARLARFMNRRAPAFSSTSQPWKSSFDWSQAPHTYLPPKHLNTLPTGQSKPLGTVQHQFGAPSSSAEKVRVARRDEIRRVFQGDWQNYRQYAWKKDALNPISAGAKDQFSGWAATLVDSLDTLWIMGLRKEFDEAVEAVAEVDFGKSTTPSVNIFETTIRYLAGLLAAYDLSKREVLLAKAIELGDFIYAGFNTPTQMPVDFIDFEAAKLGKGLRVEEWVVSASPGSLSLELTHLSQITGDSKYYDAIAPIMAIFHKHQQKTRLPGLWPMWISMSRPDIDSRKEFTLGSGADSLYEYLPKMHALLGGLEPIYDNMTSSFMEAATTHLFFRPMLPGGEDILIAGNVDVNDDGEKHLDPESEHLACFIGGTMALGGRLLGQKQHVETGAKLAKGCAYAYQAFQTGIMPERYNMVVCEPRGAPTCEWDEQKWVTERQKRPEWKGYLPKGFTTAKDPRYLLRPEAIESIFLLYRITGDESYRETAWKMFQAVNMATTAKHGHASVRDVTVMVGGEARQSNQEDYMESFWLAETLKYYYLIFSPPDLIDLDEYVLNTEAHPFRRPK